MKRIYTIGLAYSLAIGLAGFSQTASSESETRPRPKLPTIRPAPPQFDLDHAEITEDISREMIRKLNQEISEEIELVLTGSKIIRQQDQARQIQLREELIVRAGGAIEELFAASESIDGLASETKSLAVNSSSP